MSLLSINVTRCSSACWWLPWTCELWETKAGLIDIRIFAVEPEIGGALAQHVLSGQHDHAAMGTMQSFIESVELDTFEDCKQVFAAE